MRREGSQLAANATDTSRIAPGGPPPTPAVVRATSRLDGVSRGDDVEAHFHEASLLQRDHWIRLQCVVQRRALRYFRTHGLLNELDALDMLTWQGSGGFSIDASVRIEGDDRAGLERLLRYCARPPFALERFHALAGVASLASPDARLLYRFPKPTPDGRTEIVLSPLQLLERLVAFVPPPRMHRHRHHGVLAPHAGLRVVGLHRRQMKAIGELGRLEQAFGVAMTARSWSTMGKIGKVVAEG